MRTPLPATKPPAGRTRLAATIAVFAAGLAVQAAVVGFAVPGTAQVPCRLELSLAAPPRVVVGGDILVGGTITVTASAAFTTGSFLYTLTPELARIITFSVQRTTRVPAETFFEDGLAGATLLVPEGDSRISYTLGLLPLAQGQLLHRADAEVGGCGSVVITSTSTILADDVGAPAVEVDDTLPETVAAGRRYTGVWDLRANVVISQPVAVGRLVDPTGTGLYDLVLTDRGLCDVGISTYVCAAARLAPGDPWVITFTTQAGLAALHEHELGVLDGGRELIVISRTVQVEGIPFPDLDIRPDRINPGSAGKIPVAILSTALVDVPATIDPRSLTFGRTGDEPSLVACNRADLNGDGRHDLLCRFRTRVAAFARGDTQGVLKGLTFAGEAVVITDTIETVPPI